jgi:hypothetical protein
VRRADFHVPAVTKSGSLKLMEPSGPIQAYRRIALLLPCNKDGNVHRFIVEKQ